MAELCMSHRDRQLSHYTTPKLLQELKVFLRCLAPAVLMQHLTVSSWAPA